MGLAYKLRCLRWQTTTRSEEHTSELQSQSNLVCRLLLEKKNKIIGMYNHSSCRVTRDPQQMTADRRSDRQAYTLCISLGREYPMPESEAKASMLVAAVRT